MATQARLKRDAVGVPHTWRDEGWGARALIAIYCFQE